MAGVYISVCSHAEESPSVWNVLGRGIILIICILALLLFTTAGLSMFSNNYLRMLQTRLHSALLFFDVESSVLRADVLCLFTLLKIKVEDSAQ